MLDSNNIIKISILIKEKQVFIWAQFEQLIDIFNMYQVEINLLTVDTIALLELIETDISNNSNVDIKKFITKTKKLKFIKNN